MRRPLKAAGRYLARLAQSLARGWNDFWYAPADPTLLGLIRVFSGILLLYNHAVWGLVLDDFFGKTSWASRDLAEKLFADQYVYTFWWSVPERWTWLAYGLSMMVLFWLTIGLWTRLSSILSVVVVISFAHRVPEALFGLDKISMMLTLYLAVGPSGKALSFDRWLARRRAKDDSPARPSVAANFTLRLIQIHMCLIYLFAGASKLLGTAWWNGQAMWMVLGNLEYQSLDMTWLAWHPWAIELLSHLTVFWELTFCVLIWIPLLRPLVLFESLVLHVGIGACMGLWTFSLAMLIGCAAFLPPDAVAELVSKLIRARRESSRPAAPSAEPTVRSQKR